VSYELTSTQRSLAKGLLAGLVAGLVATAVKSMAEKMYPPRIHGELEPPEVLAEKLAGHDLDDDTKLIASKAIHWGFGAMAGAAYGALAEYYPAATAKEGASFGLALMTLTHETALPVMGLSAASEDQTTREHMSEAATHLLFGVVAEKVRKLARRILD
jgi:putative membrane protein